MWGRRFLNPRRTRAGVNCADEDGLSQGRRETVPRRKDQDGFAVPAKRWRVERAISWIMRARRNVRIYERLVSHSEAHITWTFITLMVRRLTRPPRPQRTTPHPLEPVKAAGKPKPIRLRMQQPQPIRLAPTTLR
ncbi:hypothetical protein AB0I77_18900 [Streptomyces sp. NPDC050619]|uniref:hypothetical protein n=1 Tax=Streptomyces sp. NPDC050619 TaxID=3157214 RepID=UPI0034448C8A